MAYTCNEIVRQALKKAGVLGVGQNPRAEDMNDAFQDLNDMIGTWARNRWLIWHLVTLEKASTGAQYYTVGPGGDYDISVRPDRLEDAYFRQLVQSQPNQIDYPLEILESREDYNKIALKQLTSFPQLIFYDSDWPMAKVYPWPIPQANLYSVLISVKAVLGAFTNLAQTVNLPPEYMAAIKFNLAARLRPSYQLPEDPSVTALAVSSLNVIRKANTQIARLYMPSDLVRPGIYNPYSDQIR